MFFYVMSTIFIILLFITCFVLVIGIIKPIFAIPWVKRESRTRKKVAIYYLSATFILFIINVIVATEVPQEIIDSNKIEVAANTKVEDAANLKEEYETKAAEEKRKLDESKAKAEVEAKAAADKEASKLNYQVLDMI